jgi:hypothetical protein
MGSVIYDLVSNEGFFALFKGVVANLILVVNPIINFVIYESLKKVALK